MNGLRKPRKERRINANPMGLVLATATRPTQAERDELMHPARESLRAFREGVASEKQYQTLRTTMTIALAIEGSGVIRGLQGHILAAIQALEAVARCARTSGTWKQRALRFDELDAITAAVHLHAEQLRVVSVGELQRLTQDLVAATAPNGGQATRVAREAIAA